MWAALARPQPQNTHHRLQQMTSLMNPTEFATRVHRQVSMFRDRHGEVARHAAGIASAHVVDLGPFDLDQLTGQLPTTAVANSPAELSDRLLSALFGSWPCDDRRRIHFVAARPPGMIVTEVDWSAWTRASGP